MDEAEIRETLHRYCHALDYGDAQGFVDCFTPDGVFTVQQCAGLASGKLTRRATGRAELLAWATAHTRAPAAYHKHTVTSLVVDFHADGHAEAHSYFVRLDEAGGVPFVYAFGRYLDRLVRCEDDRWRFTSRVVEIEARTGVPPRQK